MARNKFNPINIVKKVKQAWGEFWADLAEAEQLHRSLREASQAFRKHNEAREIELGYRTKLSEISGKTPEEIATLHYKLCISYQDIYKWYSATRKFPPEEAIIGIRHFGVDMILSAISADDRDNT